MNQQQPFPSAHSPAASTSDASATHPVPAAPDHDVPTWLRDLLTAEEATVNVVHAASEALHLLANTPAPIEAADDTVDEEIADAHIAKINEATDKFLSNLNIVQRNMRKSMRLLSTEGLSDVIPPFESNLYAEERQLELSTRAVDVVLAKIEAMKSRLDQAVPSTDQASAAQVD